MTDLLWTTDDVARELQVSTDTIAKWRSKRQGPPAVKLGSLVRYRPADVAAWVDALEDSPLGTYRVEGAEA